MLVCDNCGNHVIEGSIYCHYCRNRLAVDDSSMEQPTEGIRCPNCGLVNSSEFQFCADCDTHLREPIKQTFPFRRRRELSFVNMLANGFGFLDKHPTILVIVLIFAVIDSVFLYTFPSTPDLEFSMTLIHSLINIIISSFFVSWILVSVKQIRLKESDKSPKFAENFGHGLKYVPSIIGGYLITMIIFIIVIFVGIIIIAMVFPLFFITLPIFMVVLITLIVLFTYINQSIVFDEQGAIEGFFRSWNFTKEYFWSTLAAVLVFGLLNLLISFFSDFLYSILANSVIILIIPILSFLVKRLFNMIALLCYTWAYDECRLQKSLRT